VERLASAYGSECVGLRQDLIIAESQLRDYHSRRGKPFAHDAYLAELTCPRDQLKVGLSATAHETPIDTSFADSLGRWAIGVGVAARRRIALAARPGRGSLTRTKLSADHFELHRFAMEKGAGRQ